jgi:DNA-binding CsgD family transcriptional regulator
MPSHLSAERASEIIGYIYDCVIDPSQWDPVLARVCAELELANGVLGVIRLRHGNQILQSAVGVPAEWLSTMPDYDEDVVALWDGPARLQQFPLDEPVIQSEAVGQEAMEANRFFREQVVPHGLIDAVGFAIVREPSVLGHAVFGRHGSYGAIDDSVASGLRLLAPHFRRAITISNLFDMKAIEAAMFRSALDSVRFGIVIVDERLNVRQANAVADAMLTAGSPLRTQSGALKLPQSTAEAILEDAVARAAYDEATIGQKGIGVPVTGAGGEAFVMHVLPLRQGGARPGLVPSAAAAIFITAASRPLRLPADAIALLYDLTPAEARVFELICEGANSEVITAQLGIARSTLKRHLNRVFRKTGCRRQADLVRLAAGVSL